MKIELHMIQNFVPSCLNRDDTNSPKECEFGGVRRARISSQCIKRAIRGAQDEGKPNVFRETLNSGIGVRTKLLTTRLREKLLEVGKPESDVARAVAAFVGALLSGLEKDRVRTSVLLYLGRDEIDRLAAIAQEEWDSLLNAVAAIDAAEGEDNKKQKSAKLKEIDELLKPAKKKLAEASKEGTKAADIALFGRMLAEHPALNVEAACQVAHAVSTNKVSMEMDFYTAVDDLQPQEETGAGMMGITGYNAACFYRYAVVDLPQLVSNLGGDKKLARKAVEAFLRASAEAIPTGKQNSFAAQNPPDAIVAVAREQGPPASLANAFVKPVRASRDKDLVQASVDAMASYWSDLHSVYGSNGLTRSLYCGTRTPSEDVKPAQNGYAWTFAGSFDELVEGILDVIPEEDH